MQISESISYRILISAESLWENRKVLALMQYGCNRSERELLAQVSDIKFL
jgi:hypothetical protein